MSNNSVFDLSSKTRPSRLDRKVLVWYKVFPSQKEIPEFVPRSTISYYRNKFRVHYSIATMIAATFGYAGICYFGKRTLEGNNSKLYSEYQKSLMRKGND